MNKFLQILKEFKHTSHIKLYTCEKYIKLTSFDMAKYSVDSVVEHIKKRTDPDLLNCQIEDKVSVLNEDDDMVNYG